MPHCSSRARLAQILAGYAAPGLLAVAQASAQGHVTEPTVTPDGLVYPEGALIPRGLTKVEREYLARHPLVVEGAGQRGPYVTPNGLVHCVAEYEPTEGILVAWEQFTTLIGQMAQRITNAGDADLYVVVDTAGMDGMSGELATAQTALTAAGANMSRVRFVVRPTDTVWIRDYGPRYIYEGDCRAIIDHTYNRPRPNDDTLPVGFSSYKKHARYAIPLIHGGGNYHLDALDRSFCTRLINNENPSLTELQIHDHWQNYQNLDTTFFNPFPTSIDSTQHIDMWVQVIADDKVVVSDWPNNVGSAQDVICDNAAVTFAGMGYTVFRTPARSVSGVHYTYTNVVMCNDLVLVPSYTNGTVSPHNAPALATWQAALPGKTIVQLNCQEIIGFAGAMHCIVMHVPVPVNGAIPSTHLRNLRGGDTLTPGTNITINWISDDDVLVTGIDLLLSTDGGATYPTTIASNTADDGAHAWIVPDIDTAQARIKVVARDASANTGSDESPEDFTILGTPPGCAVDLDASTTADVPDIFMFLSLWFAGDPAADFDLSGGTPDVPDIFAFLSAWFAGCP